MSNLIAKPIIKNKFWVVEHNNGKKVATIQTALDGVVFVNGSTREKFPSVKSLGAKYNIKFDKPINKSQQSKDIYGFPVDGTAHNPLYDLRKKLPIYTKSVKSKSYYCAGYYLIKFNNVWEECFCPKLITLNRYEFIGPFESKEKLKEFKK